MSRLRYDVGYDNCQTWSPHFGQHVDRLVRDLVEQSDVRNCRIIEVGCGQGDFLRRLVNYPGSGNTGIGFDPSYAGPTSDADNRVRFERRFYDAACATIPADVVVCRHVIEHVPDPVGLLITIGQALTGSPRARLFFRNALRRMDSLRITRCPGICSTSIARISLGNRSGRRSNKRALPSSMSVTSLADNIFGSKQSSTPSRALLRSTRAEYLLWRPTSVRSRAASLLIGGTPPRSSPAGAIRPCGAAWGQRDTCASTLIDPEARLLNCVVDINRHKQGGFLPGTGHAIVAPRELSARGVASALVLNPNYFAEISAQLVAEGLHVTPIDMMHQPCEAA